MFSRANSSCNVAYIFKPKLSALELLESICDEFQVENRPTSRQGVTVKDYIDPLNAFLLQTHAAGQNNVLVIDEAQSLDVDVLEQLRLLTNLETNERKLLQIILIGQPELRDMLGQPELEQLAQRVVARFHLEPLDVAETRRYIRHRLAISGLNGPDLFERDAIQRIHKLTRGVPRRINQLCDRALLGAYGQGQSKVTLATVNAAAKEVLGLRRSASRQKKLLTADARQPTSPWLLASGVVLLSLGAMALLHWGPNGWQRSKQAESLASGVNFAQTSIQASQAASQKAVSMASSPVVASQASAASLVASVMPALAEARTEVDSQAPVAVPSTGQENQALQLLASRWGLPIKSGAAACKELPQRHQVHCFRAIGTLATLWQLDRPMVLKLSEAVAEPLISGSAASTRGNVQSGARYAVLTALDAQHATLSDAEHTQRVPLSQLALIWQGEFTTLWRAPEGHNAAALAAPMNNATRQLLIQRLAKAPGHVPAMPSPGRSNEIDVSARIQAFQKTQGLPADGVAGPVTLMQLNRATGVVEPRLSAGGVDVPVLSSK
jgi:general secretion pathway protein A